MLIGFCVWSRIPKPLKMTIPEYSLTLSTIVCHRLGDIEWALGEIQGYPQKALLNS